MLAPKAHWGCCDKLLPSNKGLASHPSRLLCREFQCSAAHVSELTQAPPFRRKPTISEADHKLSPTVISALKSDAGGRTVFLLRFVLSVL